MTIFYQVYQYQIRENPVHQTATECICFTVVLQFDVMASIFNLKS